MLVPQCIIDEIPHVQKICCYSQQFVSFQHGQVPCSKIYSELEYWFYTANIVVHWAIGREGLCAESSYARVAVTVWKINVPYRLLCHWSAWLFEATVTTPPKQCDGNLQIGIVKGRTTWGKVGRYVLHFWRQWLSHDKIRSTQAKTLLSLLSLQRAGRWKQNHLPSHSSLRLSSLYCLQGVVYEHVVCWAHMVRHKVREWCAPEEPAGMCKVGMIKHTHSHRINSSSTPPQATSSCVFLVVNHLSGFQLDRYQFILYADVSKWTHCIQGGDIYSFGPLECCRVLSVWVSYSKWSRATPFDRTSQLGL